MSISRPLRRLAAVIALLTGVALFTPVPAGAAFRTGEAGAGPGQPPPLRRAKVGFPDVDSSYAWAAPSIKYVASTNPWMHDFKKKFRPALLETRAMFASALVQAFAPDETPDPSIKFTDLPSDDPGYAYANVAVKMGWMLRTKKGAFRPDQPLTVVGIHFALISALPLEAEVQGLEGIHTADGYEFEHPSKFPELLLGMRLHLRYNHSDESQDVTPKDPLSRAEVAFSLWRAATATKYDLAALAPYQTIELPALSEEQKQFIDFGIKYVGYPYIWGGDWYTKTPTGYCCGAQPQGGFDCSGLMWWVLKSPDGGYDNTDIRGFAGWKLSQRTSSGMAAAGKALTFDQASPGDLMFYDGDNNGSVDHVDTYLGNGWALDSSSGMGGVTILRVGEGWYFDHFVHARSIMKTTVPSPSPSPSVSP